MLPERFFSQKENTIKIKLFTNLHDELTIDNQPIEFEFKVFKINFLLFLCSLIRQRRMV